MKSVVIVGGGFGGLSCAKKLACRKDIKVTIIDKRNYHLFQPLLYQVAMAGLSPAEIAFPIRSILRGRPNAEVILGEVACIDFSTKKVVVGEGQTYEYDWLVLACGASHSYFGKDEWEEFAPPLKTVEHATEIRRRVLLAYEHAETCISAEDRKRLLTFIIVGGGPTGVELAGALAEMSRFALAREFRHIDPKQTRIILIEAGARILSSFDAKLSEEAKNALESMGISVWAQTRVTAIDADGVWLGKDRIEAGCVIWAAGVQPSPLGKALGLKADPQGRVLVREDLSVEGHENVFVIGDMARLDQDGKPLPGVAPVAMQQGRAVARNIGRDLLQQSRSAFRYVDKGQVATIGRTRALAEFGKLRIFGFFAWIIWLFVHIYYLIGFKNRVLVLIEWGISYLSYRKGARLIVDKEWRSKRK